MTSDSLSPILVVHLIHGATPYALNPLLSSFQ